VAVIDVSKLKVTGFIPTGWFPAKLKVSNDGKKLIVSNAKGFGSGPNGGSTFDRGPEGSYIGSLMKGTVQVLDIPS
jgi:DNA-binding beta-propeller fold protein YncE